MTAESPLARLLHPLTVQGFLDTVWGATHYHIKRHCPGYFDDLLHGPAAVDELLAHVQPDPSTVRLVKGDDIKEGDAYRGADGGLDLDRVRDDFTGGYTIVLNRLEQYVRTIAAVSHAVEVELNFPTKVNAYVTPPVSQGFVPHYDHHDVLVCQIQGSKIWHLYGDTALAATEMRRQKQVVAADLPAPNDFRLDAGDVLYLPRGRVHAAETTAEPSVHLTVGIHAPTVLTLLTHMLHRLSFADDEVHTRLPPRHLDDADVRAGLGALVHGTLGTIAAPGVIAEGLGAMEDVLARRGRCPPVGQISNTVGIDQDTRVAKYQPLYSRVMAVTGGVALQFAQLSINEGPDHKAALLFASRSTEPFRVGDLPGLSAVRQVELARKLIVTGFLLRVPDG